MNINLLGQDLRVFLIILLTVCGVFALSNSARGKIVMTGSGLLFGPIVDFDGNWFQVRYEQRVIIRIPAQVAAPAGLKSAGKKSVPKRYKEKKIGACLWIDKIAGSRPGPKETLELVTRDGALVRAYLGDGCLAREFYAGAYMERSADGKLCVDRDLLHARTGAKCEIDKLRLLVPG